MTLEMALRLAQHYGAKSIKLGPCDAIEIEMFGPRTSETVVVKTQDPDVCACSHSIAVEHNQTGCLIGCSIDDCCPSTKEP
jgi:hypothetical protein